jgi:hypothetical protein
MSPQLVFPDHTPPSLNEAVQSILLGRRTEAIPREPGVFVRIARLDAVLPGGRVSPDARLAGPNGPPVAFLTVPEGVAGFSPEAVLSRVGYTPDEVTNLFRDGRPAAVVFRYPDGVQALAARDGELTGGVSARVALATWQNLFCTFKDLAEDEDSPLNFEADDRRFVASFPLWGRMRLVGVPSYDRVRDVGGADWRYRWLLERLLWATPSFLGTGRAADGSGGEGAPEFLGPNARFSDLAKAEALAIVALR